MYPYDDEDVTMDDSEGSLWPFGIAGVIAGIVLYFTIFHGNVVVAG